MSLAIVQRRGEQYKMLHGGMHPLTKYHTLICTFLRYDEYERTFRYVDRWLVYTDLSPF